jgi:hypothetical protein
MPQPVDPKQQRQAMPDPPADSILDMRARAGRFHAESERIKAEQAAQEQHQRDRQARHEAAARAADEQTRAALLLRVMKMQEEAKPQAEKPPVPAVYTERQDSELAAEQRRGREMLARYAKRNEDAAAARERTRVEEEAKEIPGFKIGP